MPHSFVPSQLSRPVPLGLSWLLATVMECRGRQALFHVQRPELLETLRQTAIIQSAESSNRIEGVTVDRARLAPLVRGTTKARDRPEEEIVGYRRALQWIHARHARIGVEVAMLCELHRKAQWGSIGDAGKLKRIPNDIIEISGDGRSRVRFSTVSPSETPKKLDQLVAVYNQAVRGDLLPPPLAEASLVLDFLCIHPFRDGNGRVARLLTLLVLYRRGFDVGKFISLERVIEETKDDYYDALYRSSQGWHESKHDLLPWWSYFLSVVRQSYRELEERVERTPAGAGDKTALVRAAIEEMPTEFSTAELSSACPGVSAGLIRVVLRDLRNRGELQSSRGRSARWKKIATDARAKRRAR